MDNVVSFAEFEFRKARKELSGDTYTLEDLAKNVDSESIADKLLPPEDAA